MYRVFVAIFAAFFCMAGAKADIFTVDPSVGLSSTFHWSNGIGVANDSYLLTVTGSSRVSVILGDCCLPGDEFVLKLDNAAVNWSIKSYVMGNFIGYADDIYLSAGAHRFDIYLISNAPGFSSGGGTATFSPAIAVPELGAYVLLLAGLLLVACWYRSTPGEAHRLFALSDAADS